MERHQYYGKQRAGKKFRLRFDWDSSGRLLFYSVIVGFLAGLLAALFYTGFHHVENAVEQIYRTTGIEFPAPEDYTAQSGPLPGLTYLDVERRDVFFDGLVLPRYWSLILLIPAFGGLVCGFLVWTFAPEAGGESSDGVIRAFHFRNGTIRNRVPIVKILAGFATLGSGGSAGWEGPTTLFGAGLGGSLAQKLRLNINDRRLLLLAGAAGGLGAIFQIPFGGALFATEILYASTAVEFAAMIPCVIASVVGFSTFRFFHGPPRVPELPETIGIHHASDVLLFLLFMLVVAVMGLVFVRMLLEFRNRVFRRMRLPEFLKPALGGFLLGGIALVYPQVLGGGYGWMYRLLEGQLPFLLILTLIVPKMLATALTVSSGGSGGLLAPSLFIGGLIGGALGHLSGMGFEMFGRADLAPDVVTCVLIGMGSFYAGIGKAPFAAAVIVCEMIGGNYTLLVPLLLLNLVQIAIQSPSTSLYEEQVLAPIDSEAHFGTYSVDLLQGIKVRDACRSTGCSVTIPMNATIPETTKLIASKPDSLFPVVDREGRLVGVLQAGDVWAVFRTRKKWAALSAEDLLRSMEISVFPDDDLYKALRICTEEMISELPVVDPKRPDRLLCMLYHHDIIAAYNERLAAAQWT